MQIAKKIKCRLAAFLLLAGALFTTGTTFVHAEGTETAITLPVSQTVEITGSTLTEEGKRFTYILTGADASTPMPDGSVGGIYDFSLMGDENKDIGPITYNHAGIYTYQLQQKIDIERTGYVYDRKIYSIIVHVKNTSNGLLSEVIVKNIENSKVGQLEFDNKYKPDPSNKEFMMDPPVKKTVLGTPAAKGNFEFLLKAENINYPMPEGSSEGEKIITIMGEGEEEFGTWSYTSVGTYQYSVSEINKGEQGYTYDKTVYIITDIVTDENGTLVTRRTIADAEENEADAYSFQNKYSSAPSYGGGKGTAGGVHKGTSSVKTGDSTNVILWLALIAVAAVSIVILVIRRNKKRKTHCNE